jgi:hypothetical protein
MLRDEWIVKQPDGIVWKDVEKEARHNEKFGF